MEKTKKQIEEIQKEAQACLDSHFPKGDKRRRDALVVAAIFQMLGRKEVEYIIENTSNIKKASLEVKNGK